MRTSFLALITLSLFSPLSAQQDPGGEAKIVRRDGATVTGRVEKVVIKSASLGEVTVEGAKVRKIALAAFRPLDDAACKEAERLILEIGDDDPAKREAAAEKIRGMGPGVLSLLKAHLVTDPDTKFRINQIVEVLEAVKGRTSDTVAGEGFSHDGWITSLVVDGKPLDPREIKSINFNTASGSNDAAGEWTLDTTAMLEEMRKNPQFKTMMEEGGESAVKFVDMIKSMKVTVDLNADNSFSGTMEGMGQKSTAKGTWALEGDKLTISTTEEDGRAKDPPETEVFTFNEETLVLEKDGIKMTLKRK